MANASLTMVLRHLRRVVDRQEANGVSDAHLLERFVARRDEAAFELLVWRHEKMVLSTCRRVLKNRHDAEDAFQATFLALVRKAGSIGKRESVAGWLHKVAYRVALRANAIARRQAARERQGVDLSTGAADQDAMSDPVWRDLCAVLDQEVNRLPDKYRVPVVLCYLEGKSCETAARQLGCPRGTVSIRLTRARELLRKRLTQRGVIMSAVLLATMLGDHAASAAVPAALVDSTLRAATLFAAGQAGAVGVISAKIAALTEGVLKSMLLAKLKSAALVLMALGLLGLSVGGMQAVEHSEVRGKDGVNADAQKEGQPSGKSSPVAKPPAQRVKAILQDAKEAAAAIEDDQWKAWTLQLIAEEQAKAGDKVAGARAFQESIRAAKKIKSINVLDPTMATRHTLVHIAGAQAAAGDVKGAHQTAEAIEAGNQAIEAEDKERALSEIAMAQARSGDLEGALKAAQGLSSNDRKDYVLYEVAAAQVKMGKLKEAARAVEKIGSDHLQVPALALLAKAQFKTLDKQAARQTFELALRIAARIGQEAYVEIAKAQAETGDMKAARKTAGAITKEPWKSLALLSIQTKAGDFREALQTAQAIEHEFQRGEASNEVVMTQLRSGDLKGGLEAADAIKSTYWRVVTLAAVARAQAESGNRVAAAESFKKAFAQAGDVRDEEDLGIMNLRLNALCVIVQAQAEVGEDKDAIAWAMKQTPRLKAQSLLYIAKGIALRQGGEKRP